MRRPDPARAARAGALWLVGVSALAIAGLTVGCRRDPDAEARGEPGATTAAPRRVRCAPVEVRPLRAQVVLHGTVAPLPDRDAQIAPQVAGRISDVLVREGDRVARGQPLAHIDDAALADQSREAAAQLAKAKAETNLARTTRDRIDRVFQRGIAARQELDDADARLAMAQASEAETRAAAEIAARQLGRATVRSPLAGVVLKVFRKSGELVDGTPATAILEVGDPTRLELVAIATAADLVRVHARDTAAVDIPSVSGIALRGTVAAVAPAVDRATGLGSMRISLEVAAGPRPPVGVAGVARVESGAAHPATLVPAVALRAALGDEAEVVVCGADHRAHVVRVQRGIASGPLVEIRLPRGEPAGASAGERADGGGSAADGRARALGAGMRVAVEPVLGLGEGDSIEPAP